jgi:sec-independent protein translocase protein TatA
MNLVASLTNLGGPDLIIILLIVLVLFGAKKLPELARGMGSALKEFQKAKSEFNDELQSSGQTDVAKSQPNVQKPVATVPQIENTPTSSSPEAIPRSQQTSQSGDKAQV